MIIMLSSLIHVESCPWTHCFLVILSYDDVTMEGTTCEGENYMVPSHILIVLQRNMSSVSNLPLLIHEKIGTEIESEETGNT